MGTLYTYCAAIGGTLLVAQFLLSLAGFGEHGHFDGVDGHAADFHGDASGGHFDHAGQRFVGLLSFRALVAAITIFGLIGLAALSHSHPPKPGAAFLLALAAGGSTLYGVGWLVRAMHGLRADGTVQIERSAGLTGSVYLAIPGHNEGVGKVTIEIQERTMELPATTLGEALQSGTQIVVVSVPTSGILEVAKAAEAPASPSTQHTATAGGGHVT